MQEEISKLDYTYYRAYSEAYLKSICSKDKQLLLEIDDDTASKLYTANFFLRGPIVYYLIGNNVHHLNKLTSNLYHYYHAHHKAINLIPFNASIDPFTNMEEVFICYVTKELEKFLDEKEIEAYRQAAKKDLIYGLSQQLNITSYYRHALSAVNAKKIKVLFIVNNAQLIEKIGMAFTYDRRETFVRFLVVTNHKPTETYDEAEFIYFDHKYDDVFVREQYFKSEINLPLNKLETKRLCELYKKEDPSYIDVIINIINNFNKYSRDMVKIKDILTGKNKPTTALEFINLLISSLPEEYNIYSLLPFIFSSPFGIPNREIKNIFQNFKDERILYEMVRFPEDISSLIYMDIDNNYRFIEHKFITDIQKFYSFDIYHASYIASFFKKEFDIDNVNMAINYLYQLYVSNDKNGLKKFLDHYAANSDTLSMAIIYFINSNGDKATDYIRNYLHLLSVEELAFLFYHLYDYSYNMVLNNQYLVLVLDRIRQCFEDKFPPTGLNEIQLKILMDAYIYIGKIYGKLFDEEKENMYLFHGYILRNEYNRLYNQEDFDEDYDDAIDVIYEYPQKVKDDIIDKKVRYRKVSEFDIYDLKIAKYISRDDLINGRATLLELLTSYSINERNHVMDIIEYYQDFHFKLLINDALMYYYLYLLIKDIDDLSTNKIVKFITDKYFDYFKAYEA